MTERQRAVRAPKNAARLDIGDTTLHTWTEKGLVYIEWWDYSASEWAPLSWSLGTQPLEMAEFATAILVACEWAMEGRDGK